MASATDSVLGESIIPLDALGRVRGRLAARLVGEVGEHLLDLLGDGDAHDLLRVDVDPDERALDPDQVHVHRVAANEDPVPALVRTAHVPLGAAVRVRAVHLLGLGDLDLGVELARGLGLRAEDELAHASLVAAVAVGLGREQVERLLEVVGADQLLDRGLQRALELRQLLGDVVAELDEQGGRVEHDQVVVARDELEGQAVAVRADDLLDAVADPLGLVRVRVGRQRLRAGELALRVAVLDDRHVDRLLEQQRRLAPGVQRAHGAPLGEHRDHAEADRHRHREHVARVGEGADAERLVPLRDEVVEVALRLVGVHRHDGRVGHELVADERLGHGQHCLSPLFRCHPQGLPGTPWPTSMMTKYNNRFY